MCLLLHFANLIYLFIGSGGGEIFSFKLWTSEKLIPGRAVEMSFHVFDKRMQNMCNLLLAILV